RGDPASGAAGGRPGQLKNGVTGGRWTSGTAAGQGAGGQGHQCRKGGTLMAEHPHIGTVRKLMQAMSAGDTAAVQQLLTRDCVVHRPGDHPYAGENKGLDAVLDPARRMREETNQTMRAESQPLFLDGRGHVIAVYRLTAERRGHRHDAPTAA